MFRYVSLNLKYVIPDLIMMIVSIYLSLYLRDDVNFGSFVPTVNKYLLVVLAVRIFTLTTGGAYNIIWRYISLSDALKIVRLNLISAVSVIAATYILNFGPLPRSLFLIDAVLITGMMGFSRVLRRIAFESKSDRMLKEKGRRTLIYGAGVNGRTLASRMQTDSKLGFNLVGFIDDDPLKLKKLVAGVKVIGNGHALEHFIKEMSIEDLIIASSTMSAEKKRIIVQLAASHKVKVRIIPDMTYLGSGSLEIVRDVQLSDLLNRPERKIDLNAVRDSVRGKRVLITGAGGSIGTELCRQLAACGPNKLMILDHSEFSLFEIHNELKILLGTPITHSDTSVIPLLTDVKDYNILESNFRDHLPEVIFHAAAYKHVHLVESNPQAAILNNIQGTLNVLRLAEKYGVDSFVLISTDKAVNPGGVMGATKRVCELLVTWYGNKLNRAFCSVRFGNVLGSSGSLIPILKKQIENHEPVTVTHAEMKRYFMMIPEAVSLVLNASILARPGDICILKMGEPVKIVNIARNLIALYGKTEEQVPIIFTGVRPGEKMFEELYLSGNELNTEHPDILILPSGDATAEITGAGQQIEARVLDIVEKAKEGDPNCLALLNELVHSMKPQPPATAKVVSLTLKPIGEIAD